MAAVIDNAIDYHPYEWDRRPVDASPETIAELAGFLGWDESRCRERLEDYRMSEMAAAWRAANPRTPRRIRQFYQETDLYLWEQVKWHAGPSYRTYLDSIDWLQQCYPPATHPRVLDYGCGIGTIALRMAAAGYRVTMADVPGISLAFARYRFARRGLPCDVIEVKSSRPRLPSRYDAIVCFDVLEHIPRADLAVMALANALRDGGVATIIAPFDDPGYHPHHLQSNREMFHRYPWGDVVALAGLRLNQFDFLEKEPVRSMLTRRLRWWLKRRTVHR